MPEDTDTPEEHDVLLHALREAANRVDPVPGPVREAARASFSWRTIDAELAELAYDSVLDEARLAGVRSREAPRTLTFEGPGATVELEVTEEGGRRRILGQLVPPQPGQVEVRHPAGTVAVEADEVGRFSAPDVAAGPVSLRCRWHRGRDNALETSWVVL